MESPAAWQQWEPPYCKNRRCVPGFKPELISGKQGVAPRRACMLAREGNVRSNCAHNAAALGLDTICVLSSVLNRDTRG